MTSRGRHASSDRRKLYKSVVEVFGGIILVGAAMFALLLFFADGPSTATTTSAPLTTVTTEASTTEPTVTTTTITIPTTTEVPVRLPGEVRVQVFNSMGLAGAAGRFTTRLADAGYLTLPASDYSPEQEPSRIWYRSGFSAEANVLLEFLSGALVEELPDPSVGEGADIVVVLGTGYQE